MPHSAERRNIIIDNETDPLSYRLNKDEPEYTLIKQRLTQLDKHKYKSTYLQYRKNPYFEPKRERQLANKLAKQSLSQTTSPRHRSCALFKPVPVS